MIDARPRWRHRRRPPARRGSAAAHAGAVRRAEPGSGQGDPARPGEDPDTARANAASRRLVRGSRAGARGAPSARTAAGRARCDFRTDPGVAASPRGELHRAARQCGLPLPSRRRSFRWGCTRASSGRAQSGSSGTVNPWSRPRSTARVTALEPNRSRSFVERGVECAAARVERQRELARRPSSSRFATEMPTSVRPCALDHRHRPSTSSSRAAARIVVRLRGRARQRVRAGRAREVVEAQAQHDRAADAFAPSACGV